MAPRPIETLPPSFDRMLCLGTTIFRGVVMCCLSGALAAAAPPPAATLQLHPERTSKAMRSADTRGGQLVAQEDAAGWRVRLRDKTILDGRPFGAVRIRLVTVATGAAADLVVVVVDTSTDCPVRFAVLTVTRSGDATSSPLFGTCGDLLKLDVNRDALVFTMPGPDGDGPTAIRTFRYERGAVTGPLRP